MLYRELTVPGFPDDTIGLRVSRRRIHIGNRHIGMVGDLPKAPGGYPFWLLDCRLGHWRERRKMNDYQLREYVGGVPLSSTCFLSILKSSPWVPLHRVLVHFTTRLDYAVWAACTLSVWGASCAAATTSETSIWSRSKHWQVQVCSWETPICPS